MKKTITVLITFAFAGISIPLFAQSMPSQNVTPSVQSSPEAQKSEAKGKSKAKRSKSKRTKSKASK